MIGKFGMKQTLTLLMLLATLLSGCDKLDDGDDDVMRSILPGAWAFSYVFHGDQELDPGLDFRQVIFEGDGTCAITYLDTYVPTVDDEGNPVLDEDGNQQYEPVFGAYHGTFECSSAMIRIVSHEFGDEERILLWRVVSYTAKQITAEYDFSQNGKSATATVTLDKL
ncbi:MAG: hypothetical protein IJ614_02880 [Prevotella sp.]|nr:hypothetical protein [Prevotella sp.]